MRASKKIRKPWLTSECHEMICKKNTLYHRFIKSRDGSDLAELKKFRNKLNKTLRNKTNAYFLNLFERASSRSDILWQEINRLLHSSTRQTKELELVVHNEILSGEKLADSFNI